mgnify:CR=1 FL=1
MRFSANQVPSEVDCGALRLQCLCAAVPWPRTWSITSSLECLLAGNAHIKGKSAIHLARENGELKRNFVGQNF